MRILCVLLGYIFLTFGQVKDSVKTYKLNDITVESGIVIEPERIITLPPAKLITSDASNISDLAKLMPSVKYQNNSRGESLLFFRGSGKRQVSLLFDGIPMNLPWDNWVDLSLIPVNVIKKITITKGIPSIVYGANNLAGAVNITSQQYEGESEKELNIIAGNNGYKDFSLKMTDGTDELSYLISTGFSSRDAFRLSEDFNGDRNTRRNSSSRNFNLLSKITYQYNTKSYSSFSFFYIDAEKDVPAELNVSKPRYWKYPEWRRSIFSFSGKHDFADNNNSVLTYSISKINHTSAIDQYTDINYSTVEKNYNDEDDLISTRLIFTQLIGNSSILKLAFNGSQTEHTEKVYDLFDDEGYENDFSQTLMSLGAEYEYIFDKFSIMVGSSYDYSFTPAGPVLQNDKTDDDVSLNLGLTYKFKSNVIFQLNAGRKTRFPSMREAFSEAGGKFRINPELKSEVANSYSFGINYLKDHIDTEVTAFLSYIDDGIIRIKNEIGSAKYFRVNLEEVRTYGVELRTSYIYTDRIFFDFNFSYINSKGSDGKGEYNQLLEYKPEYLIGLNINYNILQNSKFVVELSYTGEEYGLDDELLKISDYLLVNSRINYGFDLSGVEANLFFRINNIFDKLYYTQWGLPEAGREFRTGIRLKF